MSKSKLLAIYLGLAAVVLSVAFTFFPLGSDVGVACGNAWSNMDAVGVPASEGVQEACRAVRADRWVVIGSFMGLGVATLLAVADVMNREQREVAAVGSESTAEGASAA